MSTRASGILLHPTSLPGPHGSGDCGPGAYAFVDWLAAAGQQLWQILPLTGIGPGNSPYMSPSAFAGNVLLVDLAALARDGWLTAAEITPLPGESGWVDFARMVPFRLERLALAAGRFRAQATAEARDAFHAYCDREASWLDDYALFMALSEVHPGVGWQDWPAALAAREPSAVAAARAAHAQRMHVWRFAQWAFDTQWAALRRYAHARGIRIIGDVPIFVAPGSVDVWAHRDLFDLDAGGRPRVVAGVPPDYFSETGQRWGNPLYRWDAHRADGFAWWIARMRRAFEHVDVVRIDHFRGFLGCWEIPADQPTAVNGQWVPSPGAALFEAVTAALGPQAVIAEDLGVITPDVIALRRALGYPGMRILQFAWDAGADNPFLPHLYEPGTVVYTGTHDNDTTVGWWAAATDHERSHVRRYLATDGHEIAWTFVRAAWASVADSALAPMQDILELPTACRMNYPGRETGWWTWRFEWQQVQPWHAERLAELTRTYGRQAGD